MSEAVVPQKDKPISDEIPNSQVLLSITAQLPYTEKQRKLLAIVCLPQTSDLTVVKQCELAGITTPYYYDRVNDPTFQEAMVKFARSMYGMQAPKYANKYGKIALAGDRQALERINEQIGVLDPKETVVNVNRTDALASCKDKTMAGIEAFGEPVEAEYTIESEGIDEESRVDGDILQDKKREDSGLHQQGGGEQLRGSAGMDEATTHNPPMPDTNSDRGEEETTVQGGRRVNGSRPQGVRDSDV